MSRTSRNPASCAAVMYSATTDGMSRGAKAWRSSESSIGIRTSLRERRGDDRLHSTAHREITDDRHASRLTRGDEIVEDLIGGRLEEDPAISVAKHVVLQRLQLDATIA